MPSLPEKRIATKLVALGPDFFAARCAGLDTFLKRCAAHAALRRSPHLAAFLEAGEGAWAAAAGAPLPREGLTLAKQREAGGPLGAASLKELTRAAAGLLAGRADAVDPEYERVRRGLYLISLASASAHYLHVPLALCIAPACSCARTSRSWRRT